MAKMIQLTELRNMRLSNDGKTVKCDDFVTYVNPEHIMYFTTQYNWGLKKYTAVVLNGATTINVEETSEEILEFIRMTHRAEYNRNH